MFCNPFVPSALPPLINDSSCPFLRSLSLLSPWMLPARSAFPDKAQPSSTVRLNRPSLWRCATNSNTQFPRHPDERSRPNDRSVVFIKGRCGTRVRHQQVVVQELLEGGMALAAALFQANDDSELRHPLTTRACALTPSQSATPLRSSQPFVIVWRRLSTTHLCMSSPKSSTFLLCSISCVAADPLPRPRRETSRALDLRNGAERSPYQNS